MNHIVKHSLPHFGLQKACRKIEPEGHRLDNQEDRLKMRYIIRPVDTVVGINRQPSQADKTLNDYVHPHNTIGSVDGY